MPENYYAVIMAGGGGTRLWPLSRRARPKQLLNLLDEHSLFQASVRRLQGVFPPERIYVVAVPSLARELHAQIPEIPAQNFLHEPAAHNTAPVVGLAAAVLHQRNPDAVMAVLTADHFIANEGLFREYLMAAYELAGQDYLVTLGIEPTFPATGFGYIQRGQALGVYHGKQAYQAHRFKEKPSAQAAQEMLAGGDHAWNSGMFFWKVARVLEEYRRQLPDLADGLAQIEQSWGTPEQDATLARVWPGTPVISVDYGIMEHARKVAVLPAAGLGWSDVGSWDAVFDVLEHDDDENVIMNAGRLLALDSRDSLFYSSEACAGRLVVAIGIEGLVVVDTGDVLLVCRKEQAQLVRQVVERLKQEGDNYL